MKTCHVFVPVVMDTWRRVGRVMTQSVPLPVLYRTTGLHDSPASFFSLSEHLSLLTTCCLTALCLISLSSPSVLAENWWKTLIQVGVILLLHKFMSGGARSVTFSLFSPLDPLHLPCLITAWWERPEHFRADSSENWNLFVLIFKHPIHLYFEHFKNSLLNINVFLLLLIPENIGCKIIQKPQCLHDKYSLLYRTHLRDLYDNLKPKSVSFRKHVPCSVLLSKMVKN